MNNLTAGGEPICIGDDAIYTAIIEGPDYLSDVSWYFKWSGCDPDKPEEQLLNSNGVPISDTVFQMREDHVGSFALRALVTFAKAPPESGTYTVDKSVSFAMLPPDKVELANPAGVLNVNVPVVPPGPDAAPDFQIAFNIMKGDRVLNCGGTALEALNRTNYGKSPDRPMGSAQFLSSTVGAIIDLKRILGDAGFAAVPNGGLLDEFDQTLGLGLATGCGGTQTVTLSTFHFQMVKVDAGNWKLVQIEP